MRQSQLGGLVLVSSLLWGPVYGTHIQIVGRPVTSTLGPKRRGTGQASFRDNHDISYFTNVTLGGVQVEVNVDTGSSDLWVLPPIPSATSTDETATLDYAKGHVEGPIQLASLDFAGFTIPKQAYLQADPTKTRDETFSGLIGLGPDLNSRAFLAFSKNELSNVGNSAVDNILAQDSSLAPIITLMLGRDAGASTTSAQGSMSIGSIIPGYESVSAQPKLNLVPDTLLDDGQAISGHWAVLLDKDGLKINGKAVPLPPSSVKNSANPDQLLAVFDSGFSLPQAPKVVTDALYQSIPGASFDNASGFWVVPCDAEINMSWSFSGKDIPIHPLDITATGASLGDDKDKNCYGLWQPGGDALSKNGLDLIFGMAFMRNTYTLISMGHAIGLANPGFDKNTQGFVQLLPMTDPAKTHDEFVAARSSSSKNAATSVTSLTRHMVLLSAFVIGCLLHLV